MELHCLSREHSGLERFEFFAFLLVESFEIVIDVQGFPFSLTHACLMQSFVAEDAPSSVHANNTTLLHCFSCFKTAMAYLRLTKTFCTQIHIFLVARSHCWSRIYCRTELFAR